MWFFVAAFGALALAGLVMLLTLPRTLALARRRWERSYLPKDAPAEGGPTTGMVVAQALSWLLFGSLFLVILLGVSAGFFSGIDEVAQRRIAGVFLGAFFVVFSGWALLRGPRRVADEMDVAARAMWGTAPRQGQNPVFIGIVMAISLVIGAVFFVALGILGL